MKNFLERGTLALALTFAVTRCATETNDTGSQTHWLGKCSRNADCSNGLSCECGVCTRGCGGGGDGACSGLGREALCVAKPSAAHDALCATATGPAVCLPLCGDGCTSSERCVDRACVPRTATQSDGGPEASPSDGGQCRVDQHLVYPAPGCAEKPVCGSLVDDACLQYACGCNGETLEGCGHFSKPWTHLGKCANDGGLDGAPNDGGQCTPPRRLVYPEPGCSAKAVCGGPSFDPCVMEVCGCDGVTRRGCGDWGVPWSNGGPCRDAGDGSANEAGGPVVCTTVISGIPGCGSSTSCAPFDGKCDAGFDCSCFTSPACTCRKASDSRIDLDCPAP